MSERLDAYLRLIQEDEVVSEVIPKIAGMGVSTAIFVVPMALRMASNAYKAIFDKAAKACKDYTGMDKTKCLKRFKAQGVKAKMGALNKAKGMCGKDKNPEACKSKLTNKISKLQSKLKMIEF
jgi:hypothetical protein